MPRLPDNTRPDPDRPGGYIATDAGGRPWLLGRMAPALPGERRTNHWVARPAPSHPSPWRSPVAGKTLGAVAASVAAVGQPGQPAPCVSGMSEGAAQ